MRHGGDVLLPDELRERHVEERLEASAREDEVRRIGGARDFAQRVGLVEGLENRGDVVDPMLAARRTISVVRLRKGGAVANGRARRPRRRTPPAQVPAPPPASARRHDPPLATMLPERREQSHLERAVTRAMALS